MPASCLSLEVNEDSGLGAGLPHKREPAAGSDPVLYYPSYERVTPHPKVYGVYKRKVCLGSKAPLALACHPSQ